MAAIRETSKSVFASWTVWFNAIGAVAAVCVTLQDQPIIQEYPKASAFVASVYAVANIALRFKSIVPVTLA